MARGPLLRRRRGGPFRARGCRETAHRYIGAAVNIHPSTQITMSALPGRDQALALMHEHVESESLRRHMYSVEAACRAYARRFGEDEELFGITGLLHDFDYERWPDEHPVPGVEMLRERGYPEELLHAVQAHYSARTGVTPETLLDRTLWACDEITGLVTAAALVRPSRSVMDLEAKSVLKKMKDRQFAAGVDRDEVRHAAEALGVDLAEHVDFVITAMRGVAPDLGLAGPQ
jgi:putative nucleotidyltransferase with HDIG domain